MGLLSLHVKWLIRLSKDLTEKYGKGFTKINLYSFYSFYKSYPEIFQTVSGKSKKLLSWSQYAVLLQVKDKAARDWYEKEAAEQTCYARQRSVICVQVQIIPADRRRTEGGD